MNIPLKSPMKLLPEMQKKMLNFSKLVVFRAFFEKAVILENGHGRHQTGSSFLVITRKHPLRGCILAPPEGLRAPELPRF